MHPTFISTVLSVLAALALVGPPFPAFGQEATVLVATKDSSDTARTAAHFVGDGEGDQEEINKAIESLPEIGGRVLLLAGTYDIRKVSGELGGVLIQRGNVVLEGEGAATKLVQAASQETNVIRIIGSGIGDVTIRNLYVDANRDQNPLGVGDPNVSHSRFEYCGIKGFCARPGGSCEIPLHDITIENCTVLNARRLGIMLEGINLNVIDNKIGNAMSDSVELLTGPGEIRGNYFEITGRTHVAVGSDRGNNIIMADNIVHVKETGDIDIGFRSWANSHRHVIANNVVMVEKGGKCGTAMDIRGFGAVVTGNNVYTANDDPLPLNIVGGNTLVTGNMFENVVLVVNDKTPEQKPIYINNNLMENSNIDHQNGTLVTDWIRNGN